VAPFRDGPPGVGTFLGDAEYGVVRPNVAVGFGVARFEPARWRFDWDVAGVPAGGHELFIYARSTVSWAWTEARRPVTSAPVIAGEPGASDRSGPGHPTPRARHGPPHHRYAGA